MNNDRSGRTVVLGLGNPVLGDDRVGLAVAARVAQLQTRVRVDSVDVVTSTRGGFELLDLLHGYRRAVIVDCITREEPVPGRVVELSLDDLSGCARLLNAHEIDLYQVFQLAALLGIPMPEDLTIYAIEGLDISTLTEELNPHVCAAVEPLAQWIHQSVGAHTGCSA